MAELAVSPCEFPFCGNVQTITHASFYSHEELGTPDTAPMH